MILIHTVKQQSKVEENGDFRKTNRQKKNNNKKKTHPHQKKHSFTNSKKAHVLHSKTYYGINERAVQLYFTRFLWSQLYSAISTTVTSAGSYRTLFVLDLISQKNNDKSFFSENCQMRQNICF